MAEPRGSHLAAASAYAEVYRVYATAATAGALPWVPTGMEEVRLRSALLGGFSAKVSGDAAAAGWATGILTFWMAPPVVFGLGAVTGFPGQGALQAALSGLFSAPNGSREGVAGQIAAAIDAATRTVLVTIPGIGVVPLL